MSHLPLSGQIADLVEDSRVVAVVCLEERKGKLRVLTESGREANASSKQVLHVHDAHLDVGQSRDVLIRALQTRAAAREALVPAIDVPELWEVLQEENSDFSVRDLAELTFGSASDDQISAMFCALYRDRVYFRSRAERFHPTDAATVTAILTQRAREEEKEARTRRVSAWLRASWERQQPPTPPEGPALIEMLKDVALNGEEAQSRTALMEVLRSAGLHNETDVCFQLLVRLGEWDLHENLLLLRLETRQTLPPEAAAEAEQLAQTTHWAWQEEAREDLTDRVIYTVDSVTTKDIDDGLSLIPLPGGGFEVGIHITDVAALVARDSALDIEARMRATSIYLPDQHIPMLPPVISEDLCSLREGALRPAISLLITVNDLGEVCAWRFASTILRVSQRATYKDVDAILANPSDMDERDASSLPWHTLLRIARTWRAARQACGALFLTFPEITITVGETGTVRIEREEREKDSQVLVSEMMIQTNHLAATALMNAGIPCLYRGQAAPRERLFEGAVPLDLWINYRQRMQLFRAENKTDPIFHHGLGLEAYAMTSSPLRRYTDLVNQRQLVAWLRNEPPPYTTTDLDAILTEIDRPVSQSSLLEQNRRRYWLLRLLEERRGLETMALVVAIYGQRVQLTLPEFMLETAIPAGSHPDIQPGQWLQVRVTRVQAMEDILRVVVIRTQVN